MEKLTIITSLVVGLFVVTFSAQNATYAGADGGRGDFVPSPPPNCPGAGTVVSESKISQVAGGFGGQLHDWDHFGRAAVGIGDLDGDGAADLAVGAPYDDDGTNDAGAVWILFLNQDGSVKFEQKISAIAGGFDGALTAGNHFGHAITPLGDLNGDGVTDIAVGANEGGPGAVWVLFLNSDGTVENEQKVSESSGGFGGGLDGGDKFGHRLAELGDIDGDGIVDLAVGAVGDDDGSDDAGAVWILFLNADGTVKAEQKISATIGGFVGPLYEHDYFGAGMHSVGDVNGDGITDLAVGAAYYDDAGFDMGSVWILFLDSDGTVHAEQRISASVGGFAGELGNQDYFGCSVAAPGDVDGDGTTDLAVGAFGDDDGGNARGAVWIVFLNADGTVRGEQKISATAGAFDGPLEDNDWFGIGLGVLDDLDGNGLANLVVGACYDDDGGDNRGAVWLLNLNGCLPPSPVITEHPNSVLLLGAGHLVTFSVSAYGSGPLGYQWRRDGVELVDGPDISGANTPELTVFAGFDDIGLYDCVVAGDVAETTCHAAVLGIRTSCPGDMNQDGIVDFDDIAWFVDRIGSPCP